MQIMPSNVALEPPHLRKERKRTQKQTEQNDIIDIFTCTTCNNNNVQCTLPIASVSKKNCKSQASSAIL